MTHKNTLLTLGIIIAVAVIGSFIYYSRPSDTLTGSQNVDPTPQNATLSGTYVCLPHLNTQGPQTEECAFGIKTDDGVYYAVNFGASAAAAEQFQSGAHITAEGFIVPKEALNTDQWVKYNMKGIFTVTKMLSAAAQGKLNIDAVCRGALAYTTFPDAASADAFIADCKEGKHPEVIEQYKANMGIKNDAAI